ncbi:bifunctional riboflavin kinase/FAD synthetase [Picosynechococcus sp. PCC 73109]|uniref:bifunctional riboflavin kinase/FAD synthetase n=1 Tax=Picosynechococcus sp. PCC 73109 TaxID=374982 RepID=UPI0007458413|nr:bifunctional riboflavin kinase/FAD synthetase [Picosynechococcus sp. PCC 73109]AMA09970.1 bifunctional riboflavin kinase/FMN adenylyltransferase [Picosynechococcus sp. PCC 73109]
MRVISSTTEALTPTCLALGNFDGVHRGHQRVIAPAVTQARALSQGVVVGDRFSNSPKIHATVVTFDPHPREFFSGNPQHLLTPLPEKQAFLAQFGIEQLVLLPFDRELAALSPQEFVAEILVKQLQTQSISVGSDFSFGRGRSGSATDLQAIAKSFGIDVHITPLCREAETRISSSAIREALATGQIQYANQLLGRPYSLQGTVTHGQKLGRQIGFPTANLQGEATKFLPKYGVYAVQVTSDVLPTAQWGILNIGCRPTVTTTALPTVEVHLLDYHQDLYGANLKVDLLHYLRPEQKFASLQALQNQIHQDGDRARTLLTTTSNQHERTHS